MSMASSTKLKLEVKTTDSEVARFISSENEASAFDILSKRIHVDHVFLLLVHATRSLRTSFCLTEIRAVELTFARRYVNMCKSVCFYIRLLRRIVHRNSMGRCRLQEVSFKDTLLFVCLWYEYTCTLTRRDSSNIRSGLRVPNKPESTY